MTFFNQKKVGNLVALKHFCKFMLFSPNCFKNSENKMFDFDIFEIKCVDLKQLISKCPFILFFKIKKRFKTKIKSFIWAVTECTSRHWSDTSSWSLWELPLETNTPSTVCTPSLCLSLWSTAPLSLQELQHPIHDSALWPSHSVFPLFQGSKAPSP